MCYITKQVSEVLTRLQQGDIAAIPTETVYGLAADASCEAAIRQIFACKQRPLDHPLIMHVAANWDLSSWVSYIPDYAYALMDAFWPGPLTLVLPLKPGAISPLITGGQASIAIRAPKHPLTEALLHELGKPVVAPSANPFGKISPTTAEHVAQSFPTHDFYILDGGRCALGLESTILSALSTDHYQILRHGLIDSTHIQGIITAQRADLSTRPRVSGGLATHYQPEKTVYYADRLETLSPYLNKSRAKPYVFTFSQHYQGPQHALYQFSENSDLAAYELYYQLRLADESAADFILIENPPATPPWLAIREKIVKAGSPWSEENEK